MCTEQNRGRRDCAFAPVMALFVTTVMLDNCERKLRTGASHKYARAFESPMVLVSGAAAKMSQR